MQCNAELIGV